MVSGKTPARRPAQRKSAHHQSILVDWITFADLLQCFKEVGFTRKPAAIAIAAIKVEHKRIRGRKFARRPFSSDDEVQFAQGLAAPMEPKIESELVRCSRMIRRRHHQSVGLNGTVD